MDTKLEFGRSVSCDQRENGRFLSGPPVGGSFEAKICFHHCTIAPAILSIGSTMIVKSTSKERLTVKAVNDGSNGASMTFIKMILI